MQHFHDPTPIPAAAAKQLGMISLPLVYNPLRNALEEVSELSIEIDAIIVGRYKVMAMIGKGTFSRVFQCLDLKLDRLVSIKVIRNDKDCFGEAGFTGRDKLRALRRSNLDNYQFVV